MDQSFKEQIAEAMREVASITAEQADQRKRSNPYLLFLDPRDAADIRSTTGIIPDAMNVSLYDLKVTSDAELPAALADRSGEFIVACQQGPMGALAAYALKKRGYHNVSFIEGGTQAWIDAGFPTSK